MSKDYVGQDAWDARYRDLDLRAADPRDPVRVWIECHLPQEAVSVLELGCFGRFDFWTGPSVKRTLFQKLGRRAMRSLKPLGRILPEGPASWTPYCGLAARRRSPSTRGSATT